MTMFYLTFRKTRKVVLQQLEQALKTYCQRIGRLYNTVEFTAIPEGSMSRCADGGIYRIRATDKNGQITQYFIKKNSQIEKRYFFVNPFRRHKQSHQLHHNAQIQQKLWRLRLPIPETFYIDETRGIIIQEYFVGLSLDQANRQNTATTCTIMEKVGLALGLLHSHNYAHKSLYPAHILINLQNQDFRFVDCEKTKYTINLNDFINELHVFSLLLSLVVPNRNLDRLWDNFISGYQRSKFSYAEQILSQVRPPLKQAMYKKLWFKFVSAANQWTLKQTGGFWKLLPRFRPHENPKQHIYLMKLWSAS